jgi:hypothetical protein
MATRFRPFVLDRNSCHFLWYGVVAGDGLRSVGEEDPPSSKSVCSILPIAICGPGLYGAPALLLLSITGRVAEVVSWVLSLEVVLSPRSYAARTVTLVAIA